MNPYFKVKTSFVNLLAEECPCSMAVMLDYNAASNTLRPELNGRYFVDEIFKSILFNWNICIWIQTWLQFVPRGTVNNKSALGRVMAWCWPGDNSLLGPMMIKQTGPWPIELTHWGRDKMAGIFQTTFSNQFSWMKMCKFRLRFHWSLFPMVQLTIFHHWFR